MRTEVRAIIRHSELLIGYLHSEYGLTNEECDAISQASKALQIEMLLYRLEKLSTRGIIDHETIWMTYSESDEDENPQGCTGSLHLSVRGVPGVPD